MPPIDEYITEIRKIYSTGILTNQGPQVQKLELQLKSYLQAKYIHYVANGTLALQIGIHALGIESGSEIITTPFSYVATTSSILWEHCTPVFIDIEPNHFTIDPDKIESKITKRTRAILGVHVFGHPCNIEKIDAIARKYGLKVIYDGAHAFGVKYKGKSLLLYGDISTCSFHATKLFHTIEGGACICSDSDIDKNLDLIKRFGHLGDEHYCLGINAKSSEMHAAMGIINLSYIDKIISRRKLLTDEYNKILSDRYQIITIDSAVDYNYGYYPIIFHNEKELLNALNILKSQNIYARRYFYPSLNSLPYVDHYSCPISEDIASRIACLPLYYDLNIHEVQRIAEILHEI